ncbi:MAG: hypothetical protein ACLFTH_01885 [Candidatus Woesearchaeota archaeon]
MVDTEHVIHEEEEYEKRLIRHLRHALKRADALFSHTRREEKALQRDNHNKELKFDKREERDVTALLHDMIRAFNDLIRIMRDIEMVESAEGKDAVRIHHEYKGKISQELQYLNQEIHKMLQIERRQ